MDVLKGVSEEWGQPADEGGCVDKGGQGWGKPADK